MPQQISVSPTRRQRKVLTRKAQRDRDPEMRRRCMIVLGVARGSSACEVAKSLSCAVSTVTRWVHRFNGFGIPGLCDRREDNGPQPKATPAHLRVLERLINDSPEAYGWKRSTWTLELLAKQLKRETGQPFSTTTIHRMLKRIGARWGRPRPTVRCRWKAGKRRKWRAETQALLRALPDDEVALYEDEVDIHLNPKIGNDWMSHGHQKTVLTPGQNQKRYLAGALNPKTGAIHFVEGDRKASWLFCNLLRVLVNEIYPNATRIHLFLDNYCIHKSRQTELLLQELDGRIVLHFLPPYSPEDNPIERLWKQLHDNVTRNHRCATMKELMRKVRYFLKRAAPFPRHRFVGINKTAQHARAA